MVDFAADAVLVLLATVALAAVTSGVVIKTPYSATCTASMATNRTWR